jgi:hypothetical protein
VPDEIGVFGFDVFDIMKILIEQPHPVHVMLPFIIEDASRDLRQEAIPVNEIRALEESLQEKAAEAVDAGLIQLAGKLAFPAQ